MVMMMMVNDQQKIFKFSIIYGTIIFGKKIRAIFSYDDDCSQISSKPNRIIEWMDGSEFRS